MVPLEDRSKYLSSLADKPVLNAFNSLLHNRYFTAPSEQNEINNLYFEIVNSIVQLKNEDFSKVYDQISRRVINKTSPAPFVHNDYLIFSIIAGISIFNFDPGWMRTVLDSRVKNVITGTFENLINKNYFSTIDEPAVILCYLTIVDKEKITSQLQASAYNKIIKTDLFTQSNDLITLCSITAYDNIILSRELPDKSDYQRLKIFERRFMKRSKVLSLFIYNLLLVIIFLSAYKIMAYFPNLKEKVSDIGMLLGLLGLSLTNAIGWIREKTYKLIKRTLGHSNI